MPLPKAVTIERVLKINDLLFDLQFNNASFEPKDELHIRRVRHRFVKTLLRNQIFSFDLITKHKNGSKKNLANPFEKI